MKQHITQKQWNELSDKQKIKWFKFVLNDYSFKGYKDSGYNRVDYYEMVEFGCFERIGEPSIGQMIEFLEELVPIIEPHEYWRVIINASTEPDTKEITFEEDELADALWEAVKHKLNKLDV